jgi:hypothetical protein
MDIKQASKIYIVESPSEQDVSVGRVEGKALCEILKLALIPFDYFDVAEKRGLKETLLKIAGSINSNKEDEVNITLHFSMHGNKAGLQLRSGEFITWPQFAEIIVDFVSEVGTFKHPTTGKRFCPIKLHFSACEGFDAKILKQYSPVALYWLLVGPTQPVNWSDSLIAFATLYHNTIHKTIAYDDAVEKMNLAAGLNNIFQLDLAEGWEIQK